MLANLFALETRPLWCASSCIVLAARKGARTDRSVMSDQFTSGDYRFQIEPYDWTTAAERGFTEELIDYDLDLRFRGTGLLPDLGAAPVASWFLARLAALAGSHLNLNETEHTDGGGCVIECVVSRVLRDAASETARTGQLYLFDMPAFERAGPAGYPVAEFQIVADMEGIALLGHHLAECPAEDILTAFTTALLAAPAKLRAFTVRVYDPEWDLDPEMYTPRPTRRTRNSYGWDGVHFLGADNIREAE